MRNLSSDSGDQAQERTGDALLQNTDRAHPQKHQKHQKRLHKVGGELNTNERPHLHGLV